MKLETDSANTPLWLIVILLVILVTALFAFWYYYIDANQVKLLGIVGGIVSGLIVFGLTFITVVQPMRELHRFHQMGIKGLLANRHDKEYYGRLVSNAKMDVKVMGASCSRFVDDFLDIESDDKVLFDALSKHQHLTTRLLIPQEKHMMSDDKIRARNTVLKLEKLKKNFGARVELRRFADKARHSVVKVDDDLIAGPILDEGKSKNAPAVHVSIRTNFAMKYINHFEDVWNESAPTV